MPVQLGPPFVGITRIRFKGFVWDVSANSGSPAYFWLEATTRAQQVNSRAGYWLIVIC
jgi:hypothetical protein